MTHESKQPNIDAYLAERQSWIKEAVGVICGDNEVDPVTILPLATEVRADAAPLELTPEAEAQLREVAGRFGIGGERDIPGTGDYQIVEGGLAWKVEAEAAIANPSGALIFAGSPNRKISREDEVTYLAHRLSEGTVIETEFDMVKQLAVTQDGFVATEEETLPWGYDIQAGYALVKEPTGQLTKIGEKDGVPVLLLRVDREDYIDDEGKQKYRKQPDSGDLMGFIANVRTAVGDRDSGVGLLTSNTYASRAVSAIRAGADRGRPFSVGMYGRETLAATRGGDVADGPDINQIPGELRVIFDKLKEYKQVREAKRLQDLGNASELDAGAQHEEAQALRDKWL